MPLSELAIQAYAGPAESFVGSNEYWPVPELVFDAIPFLHGYHIPLAFVGLMTFHFDHEFGYHGFGCGSRS
jgi:uncharacterized RDD family membrane protein YckC